MAESEEEQVQPEVFIEPDQMAGVWANFAQVSHSPYEFTLDFVRLEFKPPVPRGIVVARISVSPLFIEQLIAALQSNLNLYAKKTVPAEVYQDEDATEEEAKGSSSPSREDDDDPEDS